MTEPTLPAKTSASSATLGVFLLLLGLVALIGVILSVLVVLFEGPGSSAILFMGLAGAVAFLLLRAAQQRLPRTRVGVITAVVVVMFFLLGYAAIVGPSLYTNPGRANQKRTMADLRSIATAIEAYATDYQDSYPKANNLDELPQFLTPTYIRSLPRLDGWKHPFRYQRVTNADGTESYFLGSAGKDGKWEKQALSDYTTQATTNMGNDIIYSLGQFVQYPEGVPAN